jgi:hypothetical protein
MAHHKSITSIDQAHWDRLATLTGKPVEEIQAKYIEFVDSMPRPLSQLKVTAGDSVRTADDCEEKNFDISILDVIGIRLGVKFCGEGSDWSAQIKLCLLAFGSELSCYEFTLSPQDTRICLKPNFGIAKFEICVGVRGPNACLFIEGQACVWTFGWHCADFDQTLFCFS